MAILTKKDIIQAIETRDIEFSPAIDGFQLQPHAVDLRLGTTFYIPKSWTMTPNGREALNIDPLVAAQNNTSFDCIELLPGQYFEMLPHEFIIASTMEHISINNLKIMAVLYPRSSVNRRGLSVDLSGIIDTGYKGKLMIPIINNTYNQIIKVYPGERVCQIVFEELTQELTPLEAKLHGLSDAKYADANDKTLGLKRDKEEETRLIKNGDMDTLKAQFKIS